MVDETVVDCNRVPCVCKVSDCLRREPHEPDMSRISHLYYAFKVPIRTRVVGKHAEVVILCVHFRDILGVERYIRTDATRYSVADSTDLNVG